MKRPVQGRWRQTSFPHYNDMHSKTMPADSILSLTNMALFLFRLINYFENR